MEEEIEENEKLACWSEKFVAADKGKSPAGIRRRECCELRAFPSIVRD